MKSNFPAKKVEVNKYKDFVNVAKSFREAAELANEFGYYNAAGVLIIHAAIALADAITIKTLAKKVTGDSHYHVLALLKNCLSNQRSNKKALSHFEQLIHHKNLVSYSGTLYYKKDVDKLTKHYRRFAQWANSILEQ